jgi:hypothetical protein
MNNMPVCGHRSEAKSHLIDTITISNKIGVRDTGCRPQEVIWIELAQYSAKQRALSVRFSLLVLFLIS